MSKVIICANQKGGVAKTTTAVNLGIGLARAGRKVLIIDNDPQGSLTEALGYQQPDELEITLANVMEWALNEEEFDLEAGILHHEEGVDLMPAYSHIPKWKLCFRVCLNDNSFPTPLALIHKILVSLSHFSGCCPVKKGGHYKRPQDPFGFHGPVILNLNQSLICLCNMFKYIFKSI